MTVEPSSWKDFADHFITSFPEHMKSEVMKFTADNYTKQSKEVFSSPHQEKIIFESFHRSSSLGEHAGSGK